MAQSLDHFQALFEADEDPWDYRTRWYEKRKRALMLASLPRERYASACEPGCANGEFSAMLARRCDQLVASDGVPAAVRIARRRLAPQPNASVQLARMPDDWPAGIYDLVVLSEFVYYLDRTQATALCENVRGSLAPHATVLACHWRHTLDDALLSAHDVHELLHGGLYLPRHSSIVEPDFLLDVWSGEKTHGAADDRESDANASAAPRRGRTLARLALARRAIAFARVGADVAMAKEAKQLGGLHIFAGTGGTPTN